MAGVGVIPGMMLTQFLLTQNVAGRLERYKPQTFLNAYRHLDDASFAATVEILFGKA